MLTILDVLSSVLPFELAGVPFVLPDWQFVVTLKRSVLPL